MKRSLHVAGSGSRSGYRAFTLLELLVAMTVLAMLLIILLAMVDGATRLWRQSEDRVDSYREARAALNVIAADLATVYQTRNPDLFKVETAGEPSLKFLASKPSGYQDADAQGDLCAITIDRRWGRTTSSSTETFSLYRTFLPSTDTLSAIRAGDPFAIQANPEVLARHITDFRITAWTMDGPTPRAFEQSVETPIPDMVEISITAVNNTVAQRLAGNRAKWSDTTSPQIEQHAREFTARIHLPAAPSAVPSPSPTPSVIP